MSTPLPRPNPFDKTRLPTSNLAYVKCLELEGRHTDAMKAGKLTVLTCARFLGYMLVEAPADAGREEFASDVVGCKDDEALQALADLYKNHLIRCFLRNQGRHPSTPFSGFTEEEWASSPQGASTNHIEAKKNALIRDGHRCILSGELEAASLEADRIQYDGGDVTITRAAYIFDQSTHDDNLGAKKWHHAGSFQALLGRFGQIDIDKLDGSNIHRLENVLTLDHSVGGWFGQLKIWLERNPDDPVHYYRPAATKPFLLKRLQARVQFTTPDPDIYPLPDPQYLAVHAACARAAHRSGVTEYLYIVFREMEETNVLANDGSSGDVLYHAMIRHLDIEIQGI